MSVRGGLRAAACALAFVLGLGAMCGAIHEALPFPEVPTVRTKVEYFAGHHDEYDTLFVGTSRIYYQIIPALFDQLTASAGRPTRSFNAGIASLNPPEDSYYLDQLLRTPPKRLRWVFIEISDLKTVVGQEKLGTVRAIYWHDWERMALLLRRTLYMKPDGKKRKWWRKVQIRLEPFGDFFDHVPLFVRNQLNLGRGNILTARLAYYGPPQRALPEKILGDDLAGWIRTGRPEEIAGANLTAYTAALAERRATKPVPDYGDPVSQDAVERMIAKVKQLGATPVLVIPPTTNKRNFYLSPDRQQGTLILDFSDLEKYPELFAIGNRLDTQHLNTVGAEAFTRIFARVWMDASQPRK